MALYGGHFSTFSLKSLDILPCSTCFSSQSARVPPRFPTQHGQLAASHVWNCSDKKILPQCTSNGTVSKTAIQRIAEKLRSLGYADEIDEAKPELGPGSPGEIFIPSCHALSKNRVGFTIDRSWSSPESPIPQPGSGFAITRFHEIHRESEKQKGSNGGKKKPEIAPTVAELTIPRPELKRLQSIGIRLEKKIKVGKAGITEGIVNGIHERWRRAELVKIKCEDLCRMNMKRTHEILERKTGGLVVWRSGSVIILYRGANYKYPYFLSDSVPRDEIVDNEVSTESGVGYEDGEGGANSSDTVGGNSASTKPIPSSGSARSSLVLGAGSPQRVRFQLSGEVELEEEANRLLDGLGPRFTDWWGYGPSPVDADLLPAIVTGYRKPFRLLPYGVKPKLTDWEMTVLRRLGRPLPCHFALGRNRNLQGLAAAMIKLWERCEIAKIAVKRGVQNTNSEIMAEELKRLTGGTLLSRDREFIVFYRGKDFLPPAVSTAIEERRKSQISRGLEGLEVGSTLPNPQMELVEAEKDSEGDLVAEKRKLCFAESAAKRMELKLSLALQKKEKAEKLLEELEKRSEPLKPEVDLEDISEEERHMLRKVGLRMKAFLLLGRRGVFDGTVENMHLHWKYRELVKIISKDKSIEEVHKAARILESESGGILVAVERVNKGHAIIVYRGKNYQRPADLRPRSLLNKKEAMRRSLEAQRRESLKLHVLELNRNIEQLNLQMGKDNIETNFVQSTEFMGSTSEFEAANCIPNSLEPVFHHDNMKDEGKSEANASSSHSSEFKVSWSDADEITNFPNTVKESAFVADVECQDVPVDLISDSKDDFLGIEPNCSSEPVVAKAYSALFVDERGDTCDHHESTSHPEYMMPQGGSIVNSLTDDDDDDDDDNDDDDEARLSGVESREISSIESDKISARSSLPEEEIPFKAEPLSNKDRLVLRKQALKMKKRAIFAIGKSNAITGLARAIRTHFKKHPLAIVNIKGRAKDTSVQEVVFELEQATGGVLVSREPNKVILYRGWGAEEGQASSVKEGRGCRTEALRDGECGVEEEAISPQLMDAIRLECGLQPTNSEEM